MLRRSLHAGQPPGQLRLRGRGQQIGGIDDAARPRREVIAGGRIPVRRRGGAGRERQASEKQAYAQLPFPKSTVGAFSAPALAWNGVIGLAP